MPPDKSKVQPDLRKFGLNATLFFATPHNLGALKFILQWKHGPLTTGPPGKSKLPLVKHRGQFARPDCPCQKEWILLILKGPSVSIKETPRKLQTKSPLSRRARRRRRWQGSEHTATPDERWGPSSSLGDGGGQSKCTLILDQP